MVFLCAQNVQIVFDRCSTANGELIWGIPLAIGDQLVFKRTTNGANAYLPVVIKIPIIYAILKK